MTFPKVSQPVRTVGIPLEMSKLVVILLHGRGGSPEDILEFSKVLSCDECTFLAPQAANGIWFPYPFTAPLEQNEPWLTSALDRITNLIRQTLEVGINQDNLVILGFSQGACLALEYAARHPKRYGAIIALSGGLIGPLKFPIQHIGNMDNTPIFIGCSDIDPYIPLKRVQDTAKVFTELGADVDKRIYPGFGHMINMDEIQAIRALLRDLSKVTSGS